VIVIDVGCARYGGDYSIERLIEEFSPDVLYGFDPNPAVTVTGEALATREDRTTKIILDNSAAWTYDGEIGYVDDGLNSWITERHEEPRVPCFDLARFIRDLPQESEIVLKIDAEGAEYELLRHLIGTGTDSLLKLAWVEWHGSPTSRSDRAWIEAEIGCELAEWCW
jgi:FkbM family methyltransferase